MAKSPPDFVLIPDGFLSVREAYRDLVALLNAVAGCDPITGLSKAEKNAATEEERRQHWRMRAAREGHAQRLLWRAISAGGSSQGLDVYSPSPSGSADRFPSTEFAQGCDPGASLKVARLRDLNRPNDAPPLFVRATDWQRQRTAWLRLLRPSRASVENQVTKWLQQQFEAIPVEKDRRRKPDFRKEAQDQFPIPTEGFNRVWKRVAPKYGRWNRRGAPRKLPE